MKKLSELTKDELKKLYDKNSDFANKIDERVYDTLSFYQNDLLECLFVKNGREQGFRYYDNYNSFFYRLTDAEQFINGLNDEIGDYFSEDDRLVYDEMIKLADEYWNMTTDEQLDDKGEKLYEKMEADAKRILQAIENMLHDYEYPTDDLIEQEIEACVDKDYGYMADYMVDDDGAIHTGIEIIWK